MTPAGTPVPDDAAVVVALSNLLEAAGGHGGVALVSRRPNAYASSSVSEIVTVDVPGVGRRELFLKYDRVAPDAEPRCRHGLAYCGRVHERIVSRLALPHVRCLGPAAIGSPPVAALVFEHLAGALRVNEAPDESGVLSAAAWCGRLHAWGAGMVDDASLRFLARHDLAWYRAWATRALSLAAAVGSSPPSLARICDDFAVRAAILAAADRTTIHGEFGPQNILWREGVVYPVDWETAAVGPGVIDLATLLFGWPADVVRRSLDAYWLALGEPAPREFAEHFTAATLFTALRWLPEPAGDDDPRWHEGIARLEAAAAVG